MKPKYVSVLDIVRQVSAKAKDALQAFYTFQKHELNIVQNCKKKNQTI